MEEITSDQLRRTTSEVLDRALKGESLTVTRNARPVAVLVPAEQYETLCGITVKNLAALLDVTLLDVTAAIGRLTDTHGADAVLLRSDDNLRNSVVHRDGAALVAFRIATVLAEEGVGR